VAPTFPVPLVIPTSDGKICWMDVSAYLRRESAGGKTVRQIVFAGERFDAVSVQNWRKRVLAAGRQDEQNLQDNRRKETC